MLGGKSIIGVCVTEIHKELKPEFIENLNDALLSENCKIVVFNGLLDAYDSCVYDAGASSVFGFVDYDIIDCLIVYDEGLLNKSACSDTIIKAKEKNIPVILINGEEDRCFCILDDYKTAYKNLIKHVIKDHKVTNSIFIGGFRWDQEKVRNPFG